MKLSDMCILLSFMFIVVTIIFSINYIYEIRIQNIKYSYSDKIELALEGALLNSNYDLSIDDTNKIAVEKFTTANFNKEKVINEFLRLLDLNFKGYYKENFYMSKCVPVILFIEDDGVTVNIYKDNKSHEGDPHPELYLKKNIKIGGTGFYYEKAPDLDCEIEHIMPDYHLYDEYVNNECDLTVVDINKKRVCRK